MLHLNILAHDNRVNMLTLMKMFKLKNMLVRLKSKQMMHLLMRNWYFLLLNWISFLVILTCLHLRLLFFVLISKKFNYLIFQDIHNFLNNSIVDWVENDIDMQIIVTMISVETADTKLIRLKIVSVFDKIDCYFMCFWQFTCH